MSPKGRKGFMTEKNFIIVNGIGYGEETKGNTVQALVREFNAHTVWRSGGWQGGHHITHDDDREIALSFFGAGVFEGADTYLHHMVISPVELFQEALELETLGISNPLETITIHENCLVTTPFHSGISRTREILRGKNKKGTIGKGVGEAIQNSHNPELTIRAGEFKDRTTILRKLENIRLSKLFAAEALVGGYSVIPEEVDDEMAVLYNKDLIPVIADAFSYTDEIVNITDDEYLKRLLGRGGSIVNEVSHGTLHHPRYGFLPHVTQIDPTSADVRATLKQENYDGNLIRIGVTRSYLTRHGAGPLPSFSQELTEQLVETHNNVANDWLGEFRVGYFDVIALQYALAFSGEHKSFDGLFISYMDVLAKRTSWPVVDAYEYTGSETNLDEYFVTIRNENMGINEIRGIKVHPDTNPEEHTRHQLKLTQLLNDCKPIITYLATVDEQDLKEFFLEFVAEKLGVPVVATAYGPKVTDRHFLPAWQENFR